VTGAEAAAGIRMGGSNRLGVASATTGLPTFRVDPPTAAGDPEVAFAVLISLRRAAGQVPHAGA
jgi:hypothetical protein